MCQKRHEHELNPPRKPLPLIEDMALESAS